MGRGSGIRRPLPSRPITRRHWERWAAAAAILVALVAGWFVLRGGGDEVDPGWLGKEPEGKIVYCSGEDVSESQRRSVEDYNDSEDSGESKATLVDDFGSSETADGQRREYLKRLEVGQCDVVYLDVIYMSEFADKKLLRDMTRYLDGIDAEDQFDDKMMRTVAHEGKRWGVPKHLDGGLIYFRTDRGDAPASWHEILTRAVPGAGERPGLRFQLDAYEGLTVVFLELAYAAGADSIVSEDGKTANIDQPETLAALNFMRAAIRRRAVPRAVTRQGDAGSFYAFSTGRATYLRSWPYVETLLRVEAQRAKADGSGTAAARGRTAENHGVAPLPPWTPGGRRVGILGGHNLVIPRSAKNPEGALHLIRFLTGEKQILEDARTASLAPVLTELWREPEVRADPALSAVNDLELELRPVIANYAQISQKIYERLRRALRNEQSRDGLAEVLREIEDEVQAVLDR